MVNFLVQLWKKCREELERGKPPLFTTTDVYDQYHILSNDPRPKGKMWRDMVEVAAFNALHNPKKCGVIRKEDLEVIPADLRSVFIREVKYETEYLSHHVSGTIDKLRNPDFAALYDKESSRRYRARQAAQGNLDSNAFALEYAKIRREEEKEANRSLAAKIVRRIFLPAPT